MISLDQVALLEQKVESAVAKIQQLQAENDALRSKCLELTNALSSKSEQLSTFENDQNLIESGIKNALERLNTIENSVLRGAVQVSSMVPPEPPVQPKPQVVTPTPKNPIQTKPVIQEQEIPSFDNLQNAPEPDMFEEESVEEENNDFGFAANEEISIPVQDDFPTESFADDENQDGIGFDIF